jgi:hypothetical protein
VSPLTPRVEKPKPPREYKLGELVAAAKLYEKFGTTNGIVAGYEWGADNKNIMRDVWYYNLRPFGDETYETLLLGEDEIRGRISV